MDLRKKLSRIKSKTKELMKEEYPFFVTASVIAVGSVVFTAALVKVTKDLPTEVVQKIRTMKTDEVQLVIRGALAEMGSCAYSDKTYVPQSLVEMTADQVMDVISRDYV